MESILYKNHLKLKEKYPDAVALYECGDEYEILGEDAVKASRILGIPLTKRMVIRKSVNMAGFHKDKLEDYIKLLVLEGRVAVISEITDQGAKTSVKQLKRK